MSYITNTTTLGGYTTGKSNYMQDEMERQKQEMINQLCRNQTVSSGLNQAAARDREVEKQRAHEEKLQKQVRDSKRRRQLLALLP